jgi:drug/metabolite transporter (DMT)-like permease
MKRLFLSGFAALVAFDTLAQVATKLIGDHAAPVSFDLPWVLRIFHEPYLLLLILGYVGAFVIYLTLLKHAPVGPLFAASHLEIVVVALVSFAVFGERLTLVQLLGCLLIVGGVLVLAATAQEEAGG